MKITFNVCGLQRSLLLFPLLFVSATTAANSLQEFNVQCVLVEKAKIARHSLAKEGKFGRANYGHQFVEGKRSVLAIRVYEDDGSGADSQFFKKATLEFKEIPSTLKKGGEVTVDVLRSYYSKGASGWVPSGGYSWAVNPFPHFRMRHDSSGLHVALKATVDVASASKHFKRPNQLIKVAIECPVVQKTVMKLTPWVGRIGTDWSSFYLQE